MFQVVCTDDCYVIYFLYLLRHVSRTNSLVLNSTDHDQNIKNIQVKELLWKSETLNVIDLFDHNEK